MSLDRWRELLSPEQREALAQAETYVKRLKMRTYGYPSLHELLKPKLVSEDPSKKLLTAELLSSRWEFTFIRHSLAFVDLEIQRIPRFRFEGIIEEGIR